MEREDVRTFDAHDPVAISEYVRVFNLRRSERRSISSSKLKQKTNRQHKSAPNSATTMNSRAMLLVVAYAIVGIVSAKPVAEEAKKTVGVDLPREQLIHRQRQLDFVGTIEGKTFYADRAALVVS